MAAGGFVIGLGTVEAAKRVHGAVVRDPDGNLVELVAKRP